MKKKSVLTFNESITFLRKFFLLIIILSLTFIWGGNCYRKKTWPFAQGYWSSYKYWMKHGTSKKNNDLINGLEVRTSIHKYNIKRNNSNYDHLAILDDKNDNFIEFIAIKGNLDTTASSKIPLTIFKVTFDIQSNTLKEKKLLTLSDNYRATDVLIDNEKRIFISYVKPDSRNFLSLVIDELIFQDGLYKTKSLYKTNLISPPFGVHQSGGKMIQMPDSEILLAVGDFQRADLVLLDQYQNGKIIRINKNTGATSIFAKGFRNPQGLMYSSLLNNIIETEHGPEGGDEINLVKSKMHYGWPYETFGIPYNADPEGELFSNFGGANYGSHDNYETPIFAFIPSIGIKAIEEMPKSQFEFPRWKNDFFVCSLKNIYRIRFSYNPKNKPEVRVLFAEPIEKGGCRDIAISKKGIIFTNEFKVIMRAKGVRG